MGVAHMLAEPGAAVELSHIGPRFPLMPDERIFFFGQDQGEPDDPESAVLARHALFRYPAERVRGRTAAAATEVRGVVEAQAAQF